MMVMLAGCTTFDSFKHTFFEEEAEESNVINIGVYEPQTGSNSEAGLSEIKGIELANSIYNTVDGYKVNLIKVDTQSTAGAAETAIKGLIKMNPVAIIGSAGEATSLVAAKYVDKSQVPTITPSSINPLITQNCKYYFRASLTNAQMGGGAADYACSQLASTHIGIISPKNDTMASALIDGFKSNVKAILGKDNEAIVLNREINADASNAKKLIKKIKKENVDTLFIPFGTEAMDKIFTLMEKNGLTNITFIGDRGWGSPEFVEMMKKHPRIKIAFPYLAVLNTDKLSSEKLTKEAERFEIEYAAKYGDEDIPTENAALGYDSYLLLINAIHNANSLKGSAIRKSLLSLKDVRCATGIFNFDKNGNTVREVNISTIKNGEVVSLHVTDTQTKAEEIGGIE